MFGSPKREVTLLPLSNESTYYVNLQTAREECCRFDKFRLTKKKLGVGRGLFGIEIADEINAT